MIRLVEKKCKNDFCYIEKSFSDRNRYLKELNVYLLNLEVTPKILSSDDEKCKICLEFIDGMELCEQNANFAKLADIFSKFHSSYMIEDKVLCHIDVNLNNFLVSEDNKFYMIDFEYAEINYPEIDIARFLTYWSYLLSNDGFRESIWIFKENYQMSHLVERSRFYNFLKSSFKQFDSYSYSVCKNRSFVDIGSNRKLLLNLF